MGRKKLSISILISGREKTTEKTLDSLKHLMEGVDSELILVDTGCGEELKKKIQQYTDIIIPFTWCDDFAKARNAGLSKATGEWFLFLDDDEWFEETTAIEEFLNSEEEKDYHQAVYLIRNYHDLEGKTYSEDWSSRMIRRTPDTRFEGRVHEQLLPATGKCKKLHSFVHHFGYAYATEEEKLNHFKRNMILMEKMMEEEPNNMRWKLQAIKEYQSVGQYGKLRKVAEEGIQLTLNHDKFFINLCRGVFYTAVLWADRFEEHYDEMFSKAQEYLKDRRNSNLVSCSLCKILIQGLSQDKNKSWAEEIVKLCDSYFAFYKEYENEEKDEQTQIIEENAIYVYDAVKEEARRSMNWIWAENLAKLESIEDFPMENKEEIVEEISHYLENNADFLKLPERVWDLGEAGILPLEEMLLALPLEQWIAQVTLLESKGYGNQWQQAEVNLCKICTKLDIRYDYFNMHDVNRKILSIFQLEENVEKMDENSFLELVSEYIVANLNYAERVYTPVAMEEAKEMLPDSIRGALAFGDAMMQKGDWSAMLKSIKKAATEWSALGALAKRFAHYVGEEQQRSTKQQEAEANVAKKQLQQMAAQVLAQVEQMKAQRQYEQALTIVKQLRQMLPEDEEILKLEKELELENGE